MAEEAGPHVAVDAGTAAARQAEPRRPFVAALSVLVAIVVLLVGVVHVGEIGIMQVRSSPRTYVQDVSYPVDRGMQCHIVTLHNTSVR